MREPVRFDHRSDPEPHEGGEIVGERIVNSIALAAFVVFAMFAIAGFVEIELERAHHRAEALALVTQAPTANEALTKRPNAPKVGPDGGATGTLTIPLAVAFKAVAKERAGQEKASWPAQDGPMGETSTGEALYAMHCRSCHGPRGEGGLLPVTLSARLGARATVGRLEPSSASLVSSYAFEQALSRPWIDDRLGHAFTVASGADWASLYAYTRTLIEANDGRARP